MDELIDQYFYEVWNQKKNASYVQIFPVFVSQIKLQFR